MERARGSLSRSTLLLRESILEADEGGAREGRMGGQGRLKRGDDEEGIGVGEDDGQESCNKGELRLLRSEREGQKESAG